MQRPPSLPRSLALSLAVTFLLVAVLSPPDPYTQLVWFALTLPVAAALGYWFARRGHRLLGDS